MNDPAALPTRKRRATKYGLWGGLLVALLMLFGHRLWLPSLASACLPRLARETAGVELEARVIRLDGGQLELRGVAASSTEVGGPLRSLQAERVVLRYSLAALWREGLGGLEALAVEGLHLDLLLTGEGESLTESSATGLPELPERLPRIDVEIAKLALALPGGVTCSANAARLVANDEGHLDLGQLTFSGGPPDSTWTTRPLALRGRWQSAVVHDLVLLVDAQPLLRSERANLARILEGAEPIEIEFDIGGGLSAFVDGAGLRGSLHLERVNLNDLYAAAPIAIAVPQLRGELTLATEVSLAWNDLGAARASADFSLADLRYGDLAVEFCRAQARLENGWLDMPSLEFKQVNNRLHIERLRWPLFEARAGAWLQSASASAELEVNNLAALASLFAGDYVDLPPHKIALALEIKTGRAEILHGSLESAGGHLRLGAAELVAGRTWRDPWTVSLTGEAQLRDLGEVGRLFGRDDWHGSLEGDLQIAGTWPEVRGGSTLAGNDLRFGALAVGSLGFDLTLEEQRLQLTRLEASGEGIELKASGTYLLDSARFEESYLTLAVPELNNLAGDLFQSGTASVRASWSGPFDDIALEGRVESQGLHIAGLAIESARASFAVRGREWRCDELQARSDFGDLKAAFAFELDAAGQLTRAALERFSLLRKGRGLTLEERAELDIQHDAQGLAARWSRLVLAGAAGRLETSGSLSAAQLNLDIEAQALAPGVFLEGVAGAPLQLAAVDGVLHLAGPPGAPEFESRALFSGLSLGSKAVCDLRWSARSAAGRIELEEFGLSSGEQVNLALAGSLPLAFWRRGAPGAVDLSLNLDLDLGILAELGDLAEDDSPAGRVRLDGQVAGSLEALEGHLDLVAEELRGPPGLHPAAAEAGQLRGRLTLGEGFQLKGLRASLGTALDLDLDLEIDTPTNLWDLVDDPREATQMATVAATASIHQLDLEWLARSFDELVPALSRVRRGRATGELRAGGRLHEAHLAGSLLISDTDLRLASSLPSLTALQGRLRLDGAHLELEDLRGEAGGAPFEAEGTVLFQGAKSEIQISLEGEDLLIFRDRKARVRAALDLTLAGALDALSVQGKVELTSGRYAPAPEFLSLRGTSRARRARGFQLFSLREAPLDELRFDIELTSRAPFVIRNNQIDGSVRPELHLGGTGLLPVLTGTVYLDRTLLDLPSSRLELTGGTLLFHPEDPFLPVVELTGRTRVLGHSILASISGPYDAPEVILNATPHLSGEAALLLLLTGRLPDDPDAGDPAAAANRVALYLAKDRLANWFSDGSPASPDSALARFDIASGRDVSKNGVETIEASLRLTQTRGLKLWRRKHLYLTGGRDRFEDYNIGLRLIWLLR